LVVGFTVGHYKVGDGGMGVAYKATDTTLEPTVTLELASL
jgi:hypothetical protein